MHKSYRNKRDQRSKRKWDFKKTTPLTEASWGLAFLPHSLNGQDRYWAQGDKSGVSPSVC